jgi:Tfp pilus assembly protein PilN
MLYKVNMLPAKLQREGLIDVKRLVLISAATLFLALTLGGYGAFLINYTFMKNDLKDTTAQLEALAPLVSRVEQMRQERIGLEAALEEYAEILQNQKTWSVLLDDLSSIIPIDAWLVELAILRRPVETETPPADSQNSTGSPAGQDETKTAGLPHPNTITLKGYSLTVSSVGVFVMNLNYLPYFEEVKLNRISLDEQGYRFEITTILKDEV